MDSGPVHQAGGVVSPLPECAACQEAKETEYHSIRLDTSTAHLSATDFQSVGGGAWDEYTKVNTCDHGQKPLKP